MIECPDCRGRMSVLETRTIVDGQLRRRRGCKRCNRKITTVELVVPDKRQLPGEMVLIPRSALEQFTEVSVQALNDREGQ